MQLSTQLDNEESTVAFGKRLGLAAQQGCVIYLDGQLGAGKTTMCRGVLQAFGYSGAVKSPTYTLVEPYEFNATTVYHFDLYRLGEPEELEFMGIRDYFQPNSLCLVEWPSRGEGVLPPSDIQIQLAAVANGRILSANSSTQRGDHVLSLLKE
ncbi:tRNA threonylcarbamoyladenosine biosynthesis protein TsaE [Thalassocella blandensis]|nr:tRNA threonylcarbamoyladenosine biosynthesis protein TsaE [Thalassocella blandensis]